MLVTGRYAAIQRFHEQERQIRQQRLSSPQFSPALQVTTNPAQPIMINNPMSSLTSNSVSHPMPPITVLPINNMPQSSVNHQFQMPPYHQQYIMPVTAQHPINQQAVMPTAVVPTPREEEQQKNEIQVPEDLLISFD